MTIKDAVRRSAVDALRALVGATGETGRRLLSEATALGTEPLLETIETIATARGPVSFYCIGDVALWRARTLLTKEPETIEWIDTFQSGAVLWDIGANVGLYSVYAAMNSAVQVLAFEPSAANYYLLNRNIQLNGSTSCRAYCMAFSDASIADSLNMQTTGFGGALSSFGIEQDERGNQFVPSFKQGMIGLSIDDFIDRFDPPFPTHIKIDVDGIENRIVRGAVKTLADRRLQSVSIELDDARAECCIEVQSALARAGLCQVAKRHSDMIEAGTYPSQFNYQFRR
jgi:FkbM family methyltransferase